MDMRVCVCVFIYTHIDDPKGCSSYSVLGWAGFRVRSLASVIEQKCRINLWVRKSSCWEVSLWERSTLRQWRTQKLILGVHIVIATKEAISLV